MSWVKLDDGFTEHPKVMGLSDGAFRAHVSAICYSARSMTDGHIDARVAKRLGWLRRSKELIAAGLWEEAPGGGYEIHDYLKYNPSKAEVLADREISRRRSAMNADPRLARIIKERDGDECRYCGRSVSWRDRKSPTGATYDHVVPMSKGGTEHPDNLVVCCRECNFKKGARPPEEAGMNLRPARNLDGITPITRPPVPVPQKKEQQPDPPLPPTKAEVPEPDAASKRLWEVHEELTLKLVPPPHEEHQFEAWVKGGLTVADIDLALADVKAWDPPPEHPYGAFRSVVGRLLVSRSMGGSNDPGRIPERAAGAAFGGRNGSQRRQGGMARGSQGPGAFDEFDEEPPDSIRADETSVRPAPGGAADAKTPRAIRIVGGGGA